jgi:glycosyltransferase involved in cell wall biosynthesis
MQELLPGGTVVVAWDNYTTANGHWQVNGPALVLRKLPPQRLARRLVRVTARTLGWDSPPRPDAVKRFMEEHQVEVILAEYLDYGLPWVEFARNLGVQFFVHAHGYDVSRLLRVRKWRTAYRRYNRADGVISMSHFAAEKLAAAGVAAHKIHVIPYGVDVPDEPTPRAAGDSIRCVAVGRMIGKKAPLLTLEAFRRASTICPALRLDYAGGGPLLPAAQQFVRDHGLGDRVTLHGPQPNTEVKRLLRQADVFLQHSVRDPATGDEEGLPVSILEAMAQSLPVVSTRHAGIPEAVQDQETGYLVDERDSAGMAERLLALARDPERRCRMGVAGWKRAKDHFTWEKERKDLLHIMDLPSV